MEVMVWAMGTKISIRKRLDMVALGPVLMEEALEVVVEVVLVLALAMVVLGVDMDQVRVVVQVLALGA